jgi:hypothetical protein
LRAVADLEPHPFAHAARRRQPAGLVDRLRGKVVPRPARGAPGDDLDREVADPAPVRSVTPASVIASSREAVTFAAVGFLVACVVQWSTQSSKQQRSGPEAFLSPFGSSIEATVPDPPNHR